MRRISPPAFFAFAACAAALFFLDRWALQSSLQWSADLPGLGLLLGLLGAASWSLLEDTPLAPGGARLLLQLLLALGLLALGESWLYAPVTYKDGFAPLGLAGLLAGAALLWPGAQIWARRLALLAAAGLALTFAVLASRRAESGLDLFSGPLRGQLSSLLTWGLLFIGLGGLAWGAAAEPAPKLAADPMSRSRQFWLLGAVLGLGALLRFFRPAALPEGFWFDEVDLAKVAKELTDRQITTFYVDEMNSPGGYLWVCQAVFQFFGVSVEALRLLSGAFGLLAVLPFWGLARFWLGPRWALAASLAFAVMQWMLVPQRIAFMSGFALFWMLAAFWALWSAHLRGGWKPWLLAGLLLGANLHTYTPARVVPVLALAFLLLQAALDPAWRRSRGEWLALLLGFLLVGGPMLAWILGHWSEFSQRSKRVSLIADARAHGQALLPKLWGSLARHLAMFNYRGDANARHGVSGLPQLDFIMACALAPALPWVLGRSLRDARGRFLLLWALPMFLAGVLSLSSEAPQANRTVLLAPVLPLACAWALREILPRFGAAFSRPWPAAFRGAAWVLLLGLFAFNAWDLFRVWLPSAQTFRSFSPRASALARRATASPPGTAVYVSGLSREYLYYGRENFFFGDFFLGLQGRRCLRLGPSQGVAAETDGQPTRAALLIWGASDVEVETALAAQFPGLNVERVPQPFPGEGEPDFLYLAAEVPYERLKLPPKRGPLPLLWRSAETN